jgi:hypothetical protein
MSEFEAPQTALDKISAHLGLSEAAPSEDVADEPVSETGEQPTDGDGLAEFEWDGWKIQGPPEKIESLKKGTLRNEDYTRKTQEVSEAKKTLDHLRAVNETHQSEIAFVQSIAPEHRELATIDDNLKELSGIDWQKLSGDQLMRAKVVIDQLRDRKVALGESINQKRSQFANHLRAKIQELRTKSKEQASKSIENFNEDTERTIRDYAKSEGLSEAEVENLLLDPRAYRLFWKASQFDSIKAKAKDGKQAASADGVLRPGVAGERMPKAVAQKLNFGKQMKSAKTSQQKASVIEDRLASVFRGHK